MMKKSVIACLFILLIITSCTKRPAPLVLQKESPAYQVGKKIGLKHPFMDPDSNQILASSKYFQISSGEMLDWMQSAMGYRMTNLAEMDSSNLYQLIHQTLTRLSEKKLLLNVANRSRIEISEAEVDSIYRLQFRQYGSEARFTEMLHEQGIDPQFVRGDIRDNILISRHLESEVEDRGRITESQIEEAYESYRSDTVATVRHILLLTQDKSPPEKIAIRRSMESLLSRARQGEDFANLARQYTEDPGSQENGGLYENFPRGVMVKPFENAAFSVPIGEISEIVETRYGYHIMKI